jgi:Transposase
MPFFVGLDWASTAHAVCVIDEQGRIQWQGTIPHSAAGLAECVRRLHGFGRPEARRIAIERPSGVVIDTLVDAGFPVVPIHPNVVKASRPRYSSAGRKDDAGDAFLLADLLRTDGLRFRRSAPCLTRPAPCAPSSVAATTSSPSASRSPISSAPCSSASGPAPAASSPRLTRPSP